MDQQTEILLRLFEDRSAERRNLGEKCAAVTHCSLLLAAGVLGLMLLGKAEAVWHNLLFAVFVIGIGVFSDRLTAAHCRSRGCRASEVRMYRNLLEKRLDCLKLPPLNEEEAKKEATLWSWVHKMIAVLGAVLAVTAIIQGLPTIMKWLQQPGW